MRRLVAAAVAVIAVGAVPASTATAAATKCVALVVDFSTTGGGVTSSCVTVASDATSSDVLIAAHHKVTFDPRYGDDFICAIDGVPAGGCRATDDTHYWAYYHRAPGSSSWQISQEGAGTYQPKNASTDGWVYDDGQASAPQPRNVAYASICPRQSTASPTKQPATTAAARHAKRSPAPTHSSTPVTTTPSARAVPTPSADATSASASTATAAPAAPSSSSPAATIVSRATPANRSGGPPLAGILAAAAVVALAVAAAIRYRRTRT